jgi:methylmalonyl-CoA mutase C-terminal domain/subunit
MAKKTKKKSASQPKKAAPKKAAKKATAKKNSAAKKAAKKTIAKPAKKAKAAAAPKIKTKIDVKDIFASSPVIEREGGNIRILVGKAGLDGHDRGAKVIARACRDAGFEVVYTGLHQTPEMIVNTAIQEDVDVVGLSILSGAHNYLVPEIVKGLAKQGVKVGSDVLIVVGGIIPDSDFASLKKAGVSMVFTPGTSIDTITTFIRAHVKPKA